MYEELESEEVKANLVLVSNAIYDFRGVFFSGNWEELSTPLKVPPVKLQLKDENKPIICKYRRQSP